MGVATEIEQEGAVDEGRAMQGDIRRRALEAWMTKRADMMASLAERLAERMREALDLAIATDDITVMQGHRYPEVAYIDLDGVRFYLLDNEREGGLLFACETPKSPDDRHWLDVDHPSRQIEDWADVGELLAPWAGAIR